MDDLNELINDENERYWRCRRLASSTNDPATFALLAVAHAIRWSTLVNLRAESVPMVPGTSEPEEESQ